MLAIKNRNDAEQYELYTSLKNYIKTQITALGDVPVVSTSATGMIIPKVDLAKVREVRLTLHNTERATKKLTPFTYSSVLEWTATTWANYLANSWKTRWLHKRKSTDPTYSYDSIKQWFLDQWIVFAGKEKNRQALFTENLSYWYYTCKKADCTEDFIKAIKGTWKSGRSFFMSEKPYGLHYNAIMGNYSHVGLWVAVVGNKYYLVSHYTQALK